MKHLVLFLMVLALVFPAFGEEERKDVQLPPTLPERVGEYLTDAIETEHGTITHMQQVIVYGTPLDLKDMLDNGVDPNAEFVIDKETGDSISALRIAVDMVAMGRAGGSKVKLLLERGADPNKSNPLSGMTALHDAARSDLPLLAEMLLDAGADSLKPNSHGQSPYQVALELANIHAVRVIELRTDFRHPDRDRLLAEGLRHRERQMKLQGGKQQ